MLDTAGQTAPRQHTGQRLLLGGAAAGLSVFVVTFFVEGAIRPGYRPLAACGESAQLGAFRLGQYGRHHAGRAGSAFLCDRASSRALAIGTGATWGPRLIGVTGVCFLMRPSVV